MATGAPRATAVRACDAARRHPLFSRAAAYWFAALFGLSALAIRPDQLGQLVLIAGIEGFVPAATLPLGMGARVLTAMGFAGAGGLIGMKLGLAFAIPAHGGPAAQSRSDSKAGPVVGHPDSAIAGALADVGHQASQTLAVGQVRPAQPLMGRAAERLLSADLATLSPLQLLERLGLAMQSRAPTRSEPLIAPSRPHLATLDLVPPIPEASPVSFEMRYTLGDVQRRNVFG